MVAFSRFARTRRCSMARQRDRRKERFWRRMFKLFDRSGLSIRAFCSQHQLSEPSFYSWRRILQERAADQPGPANDPPPSVPSPLPLFLAVQLAAHAPPLELLL